MAEPALTPEQKLRAAVAHILDDVPQHIIASLFGVNQGRVNEAVAAVREALNFPEKKLKVITNIGE